MCINCVYVFLQQQYIFIHDCLKDYLEKKLSQGKDECLYENQAFGEISKWKHALNPADRNLSFYTYIITIIEPFISKKNHIMRRKLTCSRNALSTCPRFFSFDKMERNQNIIISTCNVHVVQELSTSIWFNIIHVNAFYWLCF